MAAGVGRGVTLTWGSDSPPEGIAGVQQKDLSVSGEPVDISSDDSAGWRELLSVPGQKSAELKVSGITKDKKLLADWYNDANMQAVVLTYADGSTISGSFYLSEYAEKASHKDAVQFDATLMSSGVVTYNAGP
jgi:predicted secreted protein